MHEALTAKILQCAISLNKPYSNAKKSNSKMQEIYIVFYSVGYPDPDPTPDPTPFFTNFKDAKKNIFSYFFLITCPQAHHLQSKKFNCFANILC
jgi:hypothetical protein